MSCCCMYIFPSLLLSSAQHSAESVASYARDTYLPKTGATHMQILGIKQQSPTSEHINRPLRVHHVSV